MRRARTKPGEEKACGHLINLCTYLKGGGSGNGARLFAVVLVIGQDTMGTN